MKIIFHPKEFGFYPKGNEEPLNYSAGKYSIELGIRAVSHSGFSILPPVNLYLPIRTYHQLSKLDLPEDKGSVSLHSSVKDFSTKPQLPS